MNETVKRILSAAVALPVYFFAIITDSFYGLPLLLVSLVISLACLYEFYQISIKEDTAGRPFIAVGLAAGTAVNLLMYYYAFGGALTFLPAFEVRALMGIFAALIVIVFALQLFRRPISGGIYSLAVTVFGVVFIVMFFSHVILMKSLKNGLFYIMILNITVMINDSAAYFGGKFFGRHKTNFAVSPKKSWEGYFFGLLFSMLSMIICGQAAQSFFGRYLFSMTEAAAAGIIISVLASIGDLAESAVKRDSSIKDSGSIIPGHGGMWDVFDALIFTMPFFYYYLVLRGF